MPFTEQELADSLRKLNVTKAMAPPFVPAIAWVAHSDKLAGLIYPLLQLWWMTDVVHVPMTWKLGWLTFAPKPTHQLDLKTSGPLP